MVVLADYSRCHRTSLDGVHEPRRRGAGSPRPPRSGEAEGATTLAKRNKITIRDLLERVRTDYEVQGQASIVSLRAHLKSWEASAVIDRPAEEIGEDDLKVVAREWQQAGSSNGTINRRMAALHRGYSLARKKVRTTVDFRELKLAESGRLVDRFSHADITAIVAKLPRDYGHFFEFACLVGTRKSQLAATLWNMVNTDSWAITWPGEVVKRREPHTIYLADRALEIIQVRHKERRLDCRYVFHVDGQPIGDIRKQLKKAFAAVGLVYGRRTGKIFHGTRRTATTALVESGVPRSVAKLITGHSTDSQFTRYAVHEAAAQRAALQRAGSYLAQQPTEPTVIPISAGS